jgi:hypothetical protein
MLGMLVVVGFTIVAITISYAGVSVFANERNTSSAARERIAKKAEREE